MKTMPLLSHLGCVGFGPRRTEARVCEPWMGPTSTLAGALSAALAGQQKETGSARRPIASASAATPILQCIMVEILRIA